MSILSDLVHKRITFSQAAKEAETWAANVVKADPTMTALAGALLSDVKQGASDFATIADTQLGIIIEPAAKAAELALETALAAATKGASVPFNPMLDSTIDNFAKHVKQAADAWALAAKAKAAAQTTAIPNDGGPTLTKAA